MATRLVCNIAGGKVTAFEGDLATSEMLNFMQQSTEWQKKIKFRFEQTKVAKTEAFRYSFNGFRSKHRIECLYAFVVVAFFEVQLYLQLFVPHSTAEWYIEYYTDP